MVIMVKILLILYVLKSKINACQYLIQKYILNVKNYQKNKNKYMIIHDHDHYIGKYRGAAHSICNLRYTIKHDIFIGLHNESNYDFKLTLKKIASYFNEDISVIAESIEKYMTFSFNIVETEIDSGKVDKNGEKITTIIKHKVRFVDTNRLLTNSLDSCVNNLSLLFDCDCKDKSNQDTKLTHNDTYIISKCITCLKRTNHKITELKQKFSATTKLTKNNINKFKLILRKGLYHYEFMDTFDKFNDTQLPSKEHFNSTFRNTKISDNDYKHAQKVWKTFNCKNMGDYHDLYVKSDTSLLAHCFENFRDTCLEKYKLDPCYFVSTPGLVYEACLKFTGIQIEILTDIDMHLMNEEGIGGGITQAIKKYASANNKYMKNYNPNQLSSFLMYLDANNLYGWAMCRKLPLNKFKWVKSISKRKEHHMKINNFLT